MNVSLTPELEKYVRLKVASGLYNNASEVIREALRAFLARDRAPAVVPSREPPAKDEVLARLAALEKPLRERGLKSMAIFGSVIRGTSARVIWSIALALATSAGSAAEFALPADGSTVIGADTGLQELHTRRTENRVQDLAREAGVAEFQVRR
jgi:Arc/MetJ-type ribon-helix-helix transcriptional regulator